MVMNLDRALDNCVDDDSLAKKLLQNERTNYTDAAEYIKSLQA